MKTIERYIKYCNLNCRFAKPGDNGACYTFTKLNCSKYNRDVDKGQRCLDYLKNRK